MTSHRQSSDTDPLTSREALPTAPRAPSGHPRTVRARGDDPSISTHVLRVWTVACRNVRSSLMDLSRSVKQKCAAMPDVDAIVAALDHAVEEINTGLKDFTEAFTDALKAIADAHEHDERIPLIGEARALLGDGVEGLTAEDLLKAMDNNGFVDMDLTGMLKRALLDMDRQLAQMEH